MSYKKKSRMENSLAYHVAELMNGIFILIGIMFALVGVSAIDYELFGPGAVMVLGIFMMMVGLSNLLIMEGDDDEDEEAGDYQS